MLGSALAVFVALFVFAITRAPGPGLDPDALGYVGSAQSLVRTGTFRVPTASWSDEDSTTTLSLWPPGYPVAIAGPVALGVPAIQSARVVNIVAAAVGAAALFALVSGVAGVGTGVVMVLVMFVTPAIVDVHLSILSEPLFLALLLVTLYVMVYARRQLVLLGVLATMVMMVRYVGASVVAAVVCWALLDRRRRMGLRVRDAVVTAIVPLAVVVWWGARTVTAPDRHGTPHLHVYGHWGFTLHQAAETVGQWLAPAAWEGVPQAVLTIAMVLVMVVAIVATALDAAPRSTSEAAFARVSVQRRVIAAEREVYLLGAACVLIVCYVGVLVVCRLFVGGTIPFDWRILSPVIVLVEAMTVVSFAHWWRASGTAIRAIMAVIGVVWVVSAGATSFDDAMYAVTEGSDFASTVWRESPMLAWVRRYGDGHTLYSNWPPAVYFHTGRIAREIPDSVEVRQQLGEYGDAMRESKGLLIAFREWSPDVVPPDSIAGLLRMREVARFPDGVVWAMR